MLPASVLDTWQCDLQIELIWNLSRVPIQRILIWLWTVQRSICTSAIFVKVYNAWTRPSNTNSWFIFLNFKKKPKMGTEWLSLTRLLMNWVCSILHYEGCEETFLAMLISIVYDFKKHTAYLNSAQAISCYRVGSLNAIFAEFLSLLMLRLSTEIIIPAVTKD